MRRLAVVLALLGMLALPAVADAHTLRKARAVKAARDALRYFAEQGARPPDLFLVAIYRPRCARVSAHRFQCGARYEYAGWDGGVLFCGAFPIWVRFASRRSYRLQTHIDRHTCAWNDEG